MTYQLEILPRRRVADSVEIIDLYVSRFSFSFVRDGTKIRCQRVI